jgi:AraC-like DNA-binding protein
MLSMSAQIRPVSASCTMGRARPCSFDDWHGSQDPVVAHEAHYPASAQGKLHSHARAQLVCATTSALDVIAGDCRWTVQPGRAAWLPGGVIHSVAGRPENTIFRSLYVRPDLAARLDGKAAVVSASPFLQDLLQRLFDIHAGHRDPALYPHLAALALDEIARAERHGEIASPRLPSPRDRRAKLICEALLDQPADRRTLEEWGKIAGASARTLERLFRDETGMSFNDWRQTCRIAAAIPKLRQGSPVKQVAWAVGYDSPSAFAATFRRLVGTNPAGTHRGH